MVVLCAVCAVCEVQCDCTSKEDYHVTLTLYSEPQIWIFHSWRCSSWVSMCLRISRDWSTLYPSVMLPNNILDACLSQGVQKVVFGTLLSGYMCGKHI